MNNRYFYFLNVNGKTWYCNLKCLIVLKKTQYKTVGNSYILKQLKFLQIVIQAAQECT